MNPHISDVLVKILMVFLTLLIIVDIAAFICFLAMCFQLLIR